eukprot:GSMAST32.ASY1.ANO1.1582.1 assembled CDS
MSSGSKRRGSRRDTFDTLLKLLLLGDSGVGKSSLLTQYVEDDFHDVIWDTAGQERFRTLTTQFYRGSQGVLMVYDITNRETFTNITHWMQQIKDNVETDPQILIVGNKSDLSSQRQVTLKEAMKLAKSYGCQHFEVSAKTDQGVKVAFQRLAEEVVHNQIKKAPKVPDKPNTGFSQSNNSNSSSNKQGNSSVQLTDGKKDSSCC